RVAGVHHRRGAGARGARGRGLAAALHRGRHRLGRDRGVAPPAQHRPAAQGHRAPDLYARGPRAALWPGPLSLAGRAVRVSRKRAVPEPDNAVHSAVIFPPRREYELYWPARRARPVPWRLRGDTAWRNSISSATSPSAPGAASTLA